MLDELRAEPPQWALAVGLPAPFEDELFRDYVERLGLDADELLHELTDRTAVLAHYRLEALLAKKLPEAWRTYVQERCAGRVGTHPLVAKLLSRTQPRPGSHV